MIMPADTSVKDMTTFDLQVMLEDIQAELLDRQVKVCKRYMMELVEEIEQVQAKDYHIILIDSDGGAMELNHITRIYDTEYCEGYDFGNHKDIVGELPIPEDEEIMACIHKNDSTPCHRCEIREKCWGDTN